MYLMDQNQLQDTKFKIDQTWSRASGAGQAPAQGIIPLKTGGLIAMKEHLAWISNSSFSYKVTKLAICEEKAYKRVFI